jgi:WD40 repeat protein
MFEAQIPEEILSYIFTFLSDKDLHTCSRVCRRWSRVCKDNNVWKSLCLRRYGPQLSLQTIQKSNSWQCLYYNKTLIENENWSKKASLVLRIINDYEAVTCLQFDDRWLITGGGIYDEIFDFSALLVDKTIRLWDMKTGQLCHVLYGHNDSISDLKFIGNVLVSCSRDRRFKIWDIPDPNDTHLIPFVRKSVHAHTKSIYCLDFDGEKIVTGSKDETIKVWSATGKFQRALHGHQRDIFTVQYLKGTIVSGGLDRNIKVWDVETGDCVRSWSAHKHWVAVLRMNEKYIVSGGDKDVKMWDLRTGQLAKQFKGHKCHLSPGWITALQFDENKIVTGSFDRTVKIWDMNTGKCFNTWHAHKDKVSCLQFDRTKLITGSKDRTIKVWDFSPIETDEKTTNRSGRKCTVM